MVEGLPETIRVGPFDFALVVISDLAAAGMSRWGECSTMEMKIRLQKTFPSPVKAADTLLHEILHAIWWTSGIRDDDKEEHLIGRFATGLVQIHRDNPWLMDWLRARLA